MSKNKTLRRLSSAALLSMTIYAQSVGPVWAKERKLAQMDSAAKIERVMEVKKSKELNIGRGEVMNISGNSITVTRSKDKAIFVVLVDSNTKILRKFAGKGELTEIKVGHELSVVGKLESGDSSTITAKVIRDLSIQKKNGEIVGTVKSIVGNYIVVTLNKGVDFTVEVGSETVLKNRKGEKIEVSEIQTGDKLRAKGMKDTDLKSLTEVTRLVDMSSPKVSRLR